MRGTGEGRTLTFQFSARSVIIPLAANKSRLNCPLTSAELLINCRYQLPVSLNCGLGQPGLALPFTATHTPTHTLNTRDTHHSLPTTWYTGGLLHTPSLASAERWCGTGGRVGGVVLGIWQMLCWVGGLGGYSWDRESALGEGWEDWERESALDEG